MIQSFSLEPDTDNPVSVFHVHTQRHNDPGPPDDGSGRPNIYRYDYKSDPYCQRMLQLPEVSQLLAREAKETAQDKHYVFIKRIWTYF